MRILVNDANILIDLATLQLLEMFSELNYDLQTTDFVLDELHPHQRDQVDALINDESFTIIETTDDHDLIGIGDLLGNSTGLSFVDCSVWYYTSKFDGILLSGDGRLRRQASAAGIEVKGILFVFDQLLLNGLINFATAIEKIKILYNINPRLPVAERDRRLIAWRRSEHIA